MRWFRTNRQFGVRLALIALALQLVLTFGHVHALSATAATAPQASQLDGAAPQDRNHSGIADTDCPICALIQLSAMSAPSVAPELPLPVTFDFVTLQSHIEVAAATAPEAPFQARAPPVA